MAGCGTASGPELHFLGNPITNGTSDTSQAHGAVVYLQISNYGCTGTLISPDWILTAGHCTDDFSESDFTVGFGNRRDSLTATRLVSEMLPHPQWDRNSLVNDIALLRLSSSAPGNIQPIPFLPANLSVEQGDVGTMLEFVGFGLTENGSAGVKLTVDNQLDLVCNQDSGYCNFNGNYAVAKSLAYDQSPGGPCSGDSGGPAFLFRSGKEYVAGVTSYGDEYCQYYGVSTKVDRFETWIRSYVGGMNGDACTQDADCDSGICAAGFCCGSSCAAECETCQSGTCQVKADGGSCADPDPCNGLETCQAGLCTAGSPPDCDDEESCTDDSCQTGVGCVHEPVAEGSSCTDDDVCNGLESCVVGVCRAGPVLNCTDYNPCTSDECHPLTGCLHPPLADEQACQMGSCGSGICRQGICYDGSEPICYSPDPCTLARCDAQDGCVFEQLANDQICGTCQTCQEGVCTLLDDCMVVKGSCGCNQGQAGGSGTLLLLLGAFAIARSRRSQG